MILTFTIFMTVFYTIIILLLVRSNKVHNYRMGMIDKVYKLCVKDINDGVYKVSRWDEFREIDHNDMVLKFWKPLNSFYKGKDFNIK